MQFDGSIKIDTRVDTKGFNAGTKKMSNSLGGLMRSLKGFTSALGLAFAGSAIFRFIKDAVKEFDVMGSSMSSTMKRLNESFMMLKAAISVAVIAALNALAPVITMVIDWLVRLIQIVVAAVAVLFGFEAKLKDIGKQAKKTEKATKGALAAFDQLDVLAKKDAGDDQSLLPEFSIPQDVIDQVKAFKDQILDFLQPAIDAFMRLKEALEPLGRAIWEGLKWAWDNILVPFGSWVMNDLLPVFLDLLAAGVRLVTTAFETLAPHAKSFFDNFLKPLGSFVGDVIIAFLEWLIERLDAVSAWIQENPEKFQTFANIIGILALGVLALVVALWAFVNAGWVIVAVIAAIILILLNWGAVWEWIKLVATEAWKDIKSVWETAKDWFTDNVISPVMKAFLDGLNWIKNKFIEIFTGIKNLVIDVAKSIIDIIQRMVDGVIASINRAKALAASIGVGAALGGAGTTLGSALNIPGLANGAVIPPNSQFLAMLGDQKSGTNIETPVDLMRQVFEDVLARNGGGSGGEIVIRFDGTMAALVREMKPAIDQENSRKGISLVRSGD